jgi:hypothetical protein
MIAAAVVLGLLLGGAKAAKGFLDLQDPEKVEESIREAELAQQNYDIAKSQLQNQMAEYNRQIEEHQKYQENALYMKIDPYAVYRESADYLVTTDYQIQPGMYFQTPNWISPVLSAYRTIANSVTMKDLPAEARAGLSEEWDADTLDKLLSVVIDENTGLITIIATPDTKERAQAILKAVREKVEASKEIVTEAAGEHNIALIAEKSVITVDQNIISAHENQQKSIATLREAADKAGEKYNKLIKPKNKSISTGNIIKSGIKYAVLGGIIGVFLCCFIYGLQFLMNGKLNDIGSIKEQYRTRIIAVLPRERKTGVIDRFLDEIDGAGGSGITAEALLHIVSASLSGAENPNIAIAGTVSEDVRKKIADQLNQSDNITICNAGDILTDPVAVQKVKSVDSVILVEAKNVSSMSDIEMASDDWSSKASTNESSDSAYISSSSEDSSIAEGSLSAALIILVLVSTKANESNNETSCFFMTFTP